MYDTIKIESRVNGLKLALLHSSAVSDKQTEPILFIHGASFPSALACGFKMRGQSWMDDLNERGYETFALDFLGYGNSDRYPQMVNNNSIGEPLGRAHEIIEDIDRAVNYILKSCQVSHVSIIAHSWGGTVAALYATKHPDKVKSIVLFASLTASDTKTQPQEKSIIQPYEELTPDQRVNAMVSLTPSGETCMLEPEVFTQWKSDWLNSDPLSRKSPTKSVRFPSGWRADFEELQSGSTYFDPEKIKSRTLIIRGEWDNAPSNEDAARLFGALKNASHKKYVVIEKSTHVMHLEKNRTQLYEQVAAFLNDTHQKRKLVAVIFEVIPTQQGKQKYLDLAAALKPELVKIDGFISIERFQSLTDPKKILSLSFWRDEEAVKRWRNTEMHRMAQTKGRHDIFEDYRLRVVTVIRDYGMFSRDEAPIDSKKIHDSKNSGKTND